MTTALYTPLTDLQENFVGEYLVDYNASAAARRAGYSPKTHGAQAAALLKNPAVRARIDIGIKEVRERQGIRAMNAWQELARAAFFDIRGFIDKNGRMVPLHEMDEDIIAALNVSCRTLKGGETVMSVRQPSRLTALLALERRFAREEEIERQVLRDEAERQAAEDEKTARERRYCSEANLAKQEETRQAQQRELDALMAERDALAAQVKPVKLPEMPVKAARRRVVAASVAPAQAVPRKAEPVTPNKAAAVAPAASLKERARQAIAALFEPAPAVEAPAAAPAMPSTPPEKPPAQEVATAQAPATAATATAAAAAPTPVVPAASADEGDAGNGDDADYEEEGSGGDGDDEPFVPTPAPAPAPAPIKRRNINLWGESTDFPRKPTPEKEYPRDGSHLPADFMIKPGVRIPGPWETFAGGPKPPGIVKDPRPQFAVGAGEFQWSDEYLEDGDT